MAETLLMPLKIHPIRAGELRHQVSLMQPAAAAGGSFNDALPAFTLAATVWACVETLTGDVTFATDKSVIGKRKLRIRLRYYAGLDTNWQVQWNGRVFTLLAVVDPDNRGVQHYLLAMEGTG